MTEARRTFSPKARWLVPAVTTVAVGLAFAIPNVVASAAPPNLPERTASELVSSTLQRTPEAMSGTVVHTSRLGLPELPANQQGIAPIDLLTGSTTVRMWSNGATSARMNLVGQTSEYAIVTKSDTKALSSEAWTYSSADNQVSHYTYAQNDDAHPEPASTLTPDALADELLASVDTSTDVSVDRTVTIASRDAYQLVFTPKDDGSLIGSVRIAVDAKTSTPLRVQVWSVNNSKQAALETSYTDVSFGQPDQSVFDFVPPAGAKVEEVAVPNLDPSTPQGEGANSKQVPKKEDATVIGAGWSSILSLSNTGMADFFAPDGGSSQEMGMDPDASELLDTVLTPVAGGKAFSTNLFSVLILDDGRVLVGAVPVSTLESAAQ